AEPLAPLPDRVAALVARAGVGEAVAATLEFVRQTGELPPLVRGAARSFLVGQSDSAGAGGRVPPFAGARIALWLEPKSRPRARDLAWANDLFGRWCEPPPPPARHFAPELCERGALVALLGAHDPLGEALERWATAAPPTGDVTWAETDNFDELS